MVPFPLPFIIFLCPCIKCSNYIVFNFPHSCVEALSSSNAKADKTDGVISDESASSTINIADNDEHTALHLACINGHLEVVKYLCAHGADLEAWYVQTVFSVLSAQLRYSSL